MGHPIVERFGRGVLGQAQDPTTIDAGQATRPSDEQEAQGAHAAEGEGVRPLPRAGLGRGDRLELEAAQQVVGQDAQLLPRAVGPIVGSGHHVEGELALDFCEGLFLRPAAAAQRTITPVRISRRAWAQRRWWVMRLGITRWISTRPFDVQGRA